MEDGVRVTESRARQARVYRAGESAPVLARAGADWAGRKSTGGATVSGNWATRTAREPATRLAIASRGARGAIARGWDRRSCCTTGRCTPCHWASWRTNGGCKGVRRGLVQHDSQLQALSLALVRKFASRVVACGVLCRVGDDNALPLCARPARPGPEPASSRAARVTASAEAPPTGFSHPCAAAS